MRFIPVIVLLACVVSPSTAAGTADARDVPHTEFGLLPALGVSSDTGIQVGAFVQAVRFGPAARPYVGRLQLQGALSLLDTADGIEAPYHDHYLRADLPGFPWGGARLRVNLGYQRLTNAGYYGVGNAAAAPAPGEGADHYTEYRRNSFDVSATLQQDIGARTLRMFFGAGLSRYSVDAPAGSRLALDAAGGRAPPGLGAYYQPTMTLGLLGDGRDHETVPTSGFFWDVALRGAAGVHAFAGATATLRLYLPLPDERFHLASRVLVDVLGGEPTLVELGRYGGVLPGAGPGGQNGIRGVPAGRFVGEAKAFGNLEARSFFLPFSVGDERMVLGAAAFADAGRVFSKRGDDGQGLGLHAGFGGGPRIRWGDSFLVRADVALAPGADASGEGDAVGFYVTTDANF